MVLRVHWDGVDGATTATDTSPLAHTLTFESNAQLDDAQKVFGTTSLLLQGTDDDVTAPDHADFTLGADDWVFEMRVRFSVLDATQQVFLSHYLNTGNQRAWFWRYSGTGTNTMEFIGHADGTTTIVTNMSRAWTPVVDTWYAIAIERAGNSIRMYVDGVVLGAAEDVTGDSYFDSNQAMRIGAVNSSGIIQEFRGWIDELRITIGASRYAGNYTVPNFPFPDS